MSLYNINSGPRGFVHPEVPWSQPTSFPRIDKSNFFGARVTACLEPAAGWVELVSGRRLTLSGECPVVKTSRGLSFQSNGSVSPSLTLTSGDVSWGWQLPFTIEILGRKIGSLGYTQSNPILGSTGPSASGWEIRSEFWDTGWGAANYAKYSYIDTNAFSASVNEWAVGHMVFSRSGSTTTVDVYKNGKLANTNGADIVATEMTSAVVFSNALGSNFQMGYMRIYAGLAMTPQMMAESIKNPWQLFAPEP